jgi:hypothetical protein
MIQSGEGDWIINSHPSGIDSDSVSWQSDCKKFVFRYDRGLFICPGMFPGQKKNTSRRLCASAVRFLSWTRMTSGGKSYQQIQTATIGWRIEETEPSALTPFRSRWEKLCFDAFVPPERRYQSGIYRGEGRRRPRACPKEVLDWGKPQSPGC